ncbi:HEAT repeat domain-containing protein [Cyanobacteria bacterium FACHB-472]|nr:HEAT repeat domain-containing protein [Cyanobacteria bacterium FACHB-472]
MSITPESVKELLGSDNFGDRIRAINQLRQLEVAIAFELIQPVVTDSNTRVRYAAVSQMDTLGHQDLEKSLTILRDRLFNDPEADVQAAAADALGALKLKDAFLDLQQVYQQSPEWLVKFSIIAALGEMGDERAFDLLQEALTSDNDLVQTAAISSLGELGDPRAVSLIVPYATHPDWQIRYRVVHALNRLGGTEARSTLEALANDQVEQVAEEAKTSLKSVS